MRKELLLTTCLLLIFFGLPLAKEFYTFPQVGEVQDRDIYLLRRPAAIGFDNNTGTKNISGASLKSSLQSFQDLTAYARKREQATFKNLTVTGNVNLPNGRVTTKSAYVDGVFIASGNVVGVNTFNGTNLQAGGNIKTIASLFKDATTARIHKSNFSNPHHVDPNQLFGTPTSSKYPLFHPGGGFTFERPLEACVNVFDGKNATCTAGATVTGAAGSAASVVNVGTISDAIFNFTIPQGFRGYSGLNGAAASVAVGTVSTGAAGTNAVVTNSGSSLAAVLNFTIPRGLDGDINNITQAQLEAKLLESGGKIKKRALSSDAETLFEVARVGGATSVFVRGDGLIVVQSVGSIQLLTFNPVGSVLEVKTSGGRNIFKAMSTAAGGTVTL